MTVTMSDIVGKPVLVDKLRPDLAAKIAKAIHDDNQRALKQKLDKERQKKKQKSAD